MTFHIPQTVPFTPETGLRHISTTSVNHGTQGDKISNEQRTGLWWVWSNFQDLVLGKKTCGYLLYAKKMFCCNFLHLIPDIKKKTFTSFCGSIKAGSGNPLRDINQKAGKHWLYLDCIFQELRPLLWAIREPDLWLGETLATRWRCNSVEMLATYAVMPGVKPGLPKLGWQVITVQWASKGCRAIHWKHKRVWEASLHKNGLFRKIGVHCALNFPFKIGWCGIHWTIHHNKFGKDCILISEWCPNPHFWGTDATARCSHCGLTMSATS